MLRTDEVHSYNSLPTLWRGIKNATKYTCMLPTHNLHIFSYFALQSVLAQCYKHYICYSVYLVLFFKI